MEELLDSGDCTNTDVGAGFVGLSRACRSVPSEILAFMVRVVARGNLTRGCLGGGGSPTRHSSLPSLGETDRGDRVDVVISGTEANRALVLSSCSSSKSRLGEIIRALCINILRLLALPSIGMTSGDGQEEYKR